MVLENRQQKPMQETATKLLTSSVQILGIMNTPRVCRMFSLLFSENRPNKSNT